MTFGQPKGVINGEGSRRHHTCVIALEGELDVNTATEGHKRLLALRLPPAMVPARFVFLDGLPVGTAGKIDRQAVMRM